MSKFVDMQVLLQYSTLLFAAKALYLPLTTRAAKYWWV